MAPRAGSREDAPRVAASKRSRTPRASRRARHEEVLEAALKVFAAKGYRAATIEDIAREMDFTAAAVYYYVKSKQSLLTEIVFRPVEALLAEAERVAALDLPPAEKIAEIIRGHLRIITEQQEWFVVMLREQPELDPEVYARLKEKDRAYHQTVREMIATGVADGSLSTNHPSIASLMLIGAMNWTLQWYNLEGPLSPAEVAEVVAGLTIEGLRTRA